MTYDKHKAGHNFWLVKSTRKIWSSNFTLLESWSP